MLDSNTSSTREVNIQPQILAIMERDTRYTLANWTATISKLWTYWKLNLRDIFCYFYFQESKNPCALFVIISLWCSPPQNKKTQPWIHPANSLLPCHSQTPCSISSSWMSSQNPSKMQVDETASSWKDVHQGYHRRSPLPRFVLKAFQSPAHRVEVWSQGGGCSTLRMFQAELEALPFTRKGCDESAFKGVVTLHKVGHRISLFMFRIVGERGLVANMILQKQWMQRERYWLKLWNYC